MSIDSKHIHAHSDHDDLMTPDNAKMLEDDARRGGFVFIAFHLSTDLSRIQSSVHASRRALVDGTEMLIIRMHQSSADVLGGASRVLGMFENDDPAGAGPSWIEYWSSGDRYDWGPGHLWFERAWEWQTPEC